MPDRNSAAGYERGIFVLQERHFPSEIKKPATGMRWCGRTFAPHDWQCDGFVSSDRTAPLYFPELILSASVQKKLPKKDPAKKAPARTPIDSFIFL
jgi:hypothetical protein